VGRERGREMAESRRKTLWEDEGVLGWGAVSAVTKGGQKLGRN
jgi:hypothetical protein